MEGSKDSVQHHMYICIFIVNFNDTYHKFSVHTVISTVQLGYMFIPITSYTNVISIHSDEWKLLLTDTTFDRL